MAIYDGFFDAALNEETNAYDRAYDAGTFTEYFEQFIGSGVCIYNNPDSMMVGFHDGNAVVAPGYLFIQGYWLKNDGPYEIHLPGAGVYAVAAHLNIGLRMVEIIAQAKASPEVYPDSLILAYVTVDAAGAGTVEDTRHTPSLCGVVDAMGALSDKVAYAVDYIDNEIAGKLQQAEADIAAQAVLLDAKIAQVAAEVDKLAPPPIGTVKFSASRDVGPEWLRCDGRFINETDYPELVAALGKLTPSNDKFQLLSDGEIAPQISNGAIYGDRMWVYSYSTRILYGVDLAGERPVKSIQLTSTDPHFASFLTPTVAKPLVLSIVPHKAGDGAKLFLTQIILDGGGIGALADYAWMEHFLLYESDFFGNEESLTMTVPFPSIVKEVDTSSGSGYYYYISYTAGCCIPQVSSRMVDGAETYYCMVGDKKSTHGGANSLRGVAAVVWNDGTTTAELSIEMSPFNKETTHPTGNQRVAFSQKNKGEAVAVNIYSVSGSEGRYNVNSKPSELFKRSGEYGYATFISGRQTPCALNIVGESRAISSFDIDLFPWASLVTNGAKSVKPKLSLPSGARIFVDAGAYLWGKNMYFIFVGTGIIFSRNLEADNFGYLDTTSVLGSITQFGYLDYSQDEGTLYIVGQDPTNSVKVAKIVLNTLYDYANDGAWLPMIASDGVPAYIKAKEPAAVEEG